MLDFEPELKSQSGLEGKKFTKATKILMPSFKGEQMMIMAYDYTGVIATHVVPYCCTMDQCVYVHFLRKILMHKIQKTRSQKLNYVIILHDNAHPHIAT